MKNRVFGSDSPVKRAAIEAKTVTDWFLGHFSFLTLGHPGSPDCAAVTLAKWACGEADRLGPSRVPGSRPDLRRNPPASSSQGLCRLLQPCPHASSVGQGCAARSLCSATRLHRREADPRRTSSRILSDLVVRRRANPVRMRSSVRTAVRSCRVVRLMPRHTSR